ncbi:MAG TPA: hypothetical protein VM733_05400 [Thermoanaerobaculia bacterium]|nr:hypothetical protein [Thermoanaerobaculia bacterium]
MPEDSIWSDVAYLVPRLSSTTRISVKPFGDGLSVLFDDAQLDLQDKIGGREDFWTAGLVAVAAPRENAQFVCQVRGFIDKSAGARALLTASVGGRTASREFEYGTVIDRQEIEPIEIPFEVTALSDRRVVIFVAIYAERQNFDEHVRIVLDSVDQAMFTIAPPAPPSAAAPASAP